LPLDVQVGDGREGPEFIVQGQQLVEGPTGHGGGQVGPLAAAEGFEDRLPVVTIPHAFHRRTSLGTPYLTAAAAKLAPISKCLARELDT
jgi:hypothetical protein